MLLRISRGVGECELGEYFVLSSFALSSAHVTFDPGLSDQRATEKVSLRFLLNN